MTLIQKIRLSRKFGRTTYLVSVPISAMALATAVMFPTEIAVCVFLKLLSIPLILYLEKSIQKGVTMYFYLNLGISRKEYYFIPVLVELVVFLLLLTIADVIIHVIR